MHQPIHKRPWVRRLALLLLILLLGYSAYRVVRPDPKLKKAEMASAAAKDWTQEHRREKGAEMRTAMEQLSTAQRNQLAAERRKRFEDEMKRYAQMSQVEKTRYLDEQIDRQEKMRQQIAQQNPNGSRGPTGGPGTFGSGGQPGMSQEEREKRRKERLDQTTPESRAAMDIYRKDMENRRRQRGLAVR
jgi:hypothetical protein